MSGPVQQSSLPPRSEVTERVKPISSGGTVQQISDFRMPAGDHVSGDDELIEGLAKYLAAAYLARQMDIPFDTAMRDYVMPHKQVGDLWQVAAQFILDCQAADNSPTPGPELVGAGQGPGRNAA